MTEKATINDIARLTGLSKGTVDRVLHNRGEVSRKSYQKVMDVIKELGYEPNL
ncbi:MAG: LacI family DNA-binding transcriptional regulator, partial [Bacteroidales bacterium]|nr:LacI family DNA-binding transcriptional regulator [Bacteroidales bacterium]